MWDTYEIYTRSLLWLGGGETGLYFTKALQVIHVLKQVLRINLHTGSALVA